MSNNKTTSFRSKLEDFFNPGPSGASQKQRMTADPEDAIDLYNSHTSKFFKANKKTDSYAEQIEVGERRIRPNIADDEDLLDQKVYGGKKVTRKQLVQLPSSDEEDGDEEPMDDEEEGEEGSSYGDGDEDMEEEDESEIEDDLPPQKLPKKRLQSSDNDEEENDDNGEDIDKALKQLKQDEEQESKYQQERVSSEIEKAKSIRIQKKIFDQFLHQRILMQKLVTGANRMPASAIIKEFAKKSEKIDAGLKNSKREIKSYIKDLTRIQKDLFTLSETTVKVKTFPEDDQDNESTTDSLFRIVDHNFSQVLPFVDETIDRWNSRTHTLKSINLHKSSTAQQQKSILEQVNSLMNEPDNKKRLTEKVLTLPQGSVKVFGQSVSEQMTTGTSMQQVFNDADFYQSLLKDFLASNDQIAGTNSGAQDDDDIYVDGADLGMTQRFLERRRKLQDAGSIQAKKEVDRRASKHRKIRYVVHEKIVNFMTPQDNLQVIGGDEGGKQSIIQSLFGMKVATNTQQQNNYGSKKVNEFEDDGIRLI